MPDKYFFEASDINTDELSCDAPFDYSACGINKKKSYWYKLFINHFF